MHFTKLILCFVNNVALIWELNTVKPAQIIPVWRGHLDSKTALFVAYCGLCIQPVNKNTF